jgi:hypothetical protein
VLFAIDLDLVFPFSEPAVGRFDVQCLSQLDILEYSCPTLKSSESGLDGLVHLASGRVYEKFLFQLHNFSLKVSFQLMLLEHVGTGFRLQQQELLQQYAVVVAAVRLKSIDPWSTSQHEGQ